MKEALFIASGGIGDCILSLCCASYLAKGSYKILVSARDEVFNPLNHVFGKKFDLEQIDESISQDNRILHEKSLRRQFWSKYSDDYKQLYYVIPDLLFNSPLAFPCSVYGISPHVIKSTRLLTRNRKILKTIYVGLNSTTEGYVYDDIVSLAVELARQVPDYEIILPIVTKWAGKDIEKPQIKDAPLNLCIQENPPIWSSFDSLSSASYFIGTDNGPSHLAYHYGIPRLILDPQFGRLPWIARWKEDYTESIPIQTQVADVVRLVKTNIEIPQTTLIPRMEVLKRPFANWPQELFFKF